MWRLRAWVNGGMYAKTFDADGKITGVVDSTGIAQATVFDAAMRLSTLSSAGLSLSASYTAADQLSSVAVNGQTQTFSFNTNLNRTSKKEFSGTVVPTPIGGQSNLPLSMSGTALAYDARKNMTFNGRSTLSYDLRGNLSGSNTAGIAASYGHNAANQRVFKTVAGSTTLFMHDETGNLSGEYSAAGAPVQEHIHLGSLPIGVMAGGVLRQVHTDYLGSPRLVGSASAPVWRWDSTDPFGANAPSVQTLVYNRRFPGQYFDVETGLHENHHRTYDPKLGRYTQPDPLGLAAGKNPFNYVNQNPFNATDSDGLLTQLIWVESNGFPHAMIRIVDNGNVGKTYSFSGALKGDAASISGLSLMALSSFMAEPILKVLTDEQVHQRYYGTGRQGELNKLHAITFRSTPKEEAALAEFMTNKVANSKYSILAIFDQAYQCSTSSNAAFSSAFFDYDAGGRRGKFFPKDFYELIKTTKFYKNRFVRESVLDATDFSKW